MAGFITNLTSYTVVILMEGLGTNGGVKYRVGFMLFDILYTNVAFTLVSVIKYVLLLCLFCCNAYGRKIKVNKGKERTVIYSGSEKNKRVLCAR